MSIAQVASLKSLIAADVFKGTDSKKAKICVYDGKDIIPITSSQITTVMVNNTLQITVNTEGLGKPKNGKLFKIKILTINKKVKEIPMK